MISASDRPHLRDRRVDDLLVYALTPQAFEELVEAGIPVEAFEILTQPLPDVGTDEGLIPRETEDGSDALQILQHVLRHPDADRRHRTVRPEAVTELLCLHGKELCYRVYTMSIRSPPPSKESRALCAR